MLTGRPKSVDCFDWNAPVSKVHFPIRLPLVGSEVGTASTRAESQLSEKTRVFNGGNVSGNIQDSSMVLSRSHRERDAVSLVDESCFLTWVLLFV